MNAGGVDKACKSNELSPCRHCFFVESNSQVSNGDMGFMLNAKSMSALGRLVANEVVIHRNFPLSRE